MAVLTPEQRALVARGWPLVSGACARWRRRCPLPTECLYDACMDALIAAARSWRPGSAPWEAWARLAMDWRVRKAILLAMQERALVVTSMQSLEHLPVAEVDPGMAVAEGWSEEGERLFRLLCALPARPRIAMWLRYGEEMRQADIARAMGVYESTVLMYLRQGRERLHAGSGLGTV